MLSFLSDGVCLLELKGLLTYLLTYLCRIKDYIIVRPKVDQRAGQLCLPHTGITKTEKNTTKHENR